MDRLATLLVTALFLGAVSCSAATELADADGDADGDADADGDGSTWSWTTVDASVPTALEGVYASSSLWAVDDRDVVICGTDFDAETGGIAEYDGETITLATDALLCLELRGTDDGELWARGRDPYTAQDVIFRRDGTSWTEVPVPGGGFCSLEALAQGSDGAATVIGSCPAGEGERQVWSHGGEGWTALETAAPALDAMTDVYGALAFEGALVFYGAGRASGLWAGGSTADLGYPEDLGLWAAVLDPDSLPLVALGARTLYAYDGAAWSAAATCPDELPSESSRCWATGVVRSRAAVILGGGSGSSGDSGSDDMRLHLWEGSTGRLRRVLAPCGGEEPQCEVEDLSATDWRVWALIRVDWVTSLVWFQDVEGD